MWLLRSGSERYADVLGVKRLEAYPSAKRGIVCQQHREVTRAQVKGVNATILQVSAGPM